MARLMLRDDQWERIAHMLPDKPGNRGRTAVNNRLFVEAVLWIGRSGYPGATCQSSLAPGAAPINALHGGW
jgi:transposase